MVESDTQDRFDIKKTLGEVQQDCGRGMHRIRAMRAELERGRPYAQHRRDWLAQVSDWRYLFEMMHTHR